MDYSFKLEDVRVEASEGVDALISKHLFNGAMVPPSLYTHDLNLALLAVKELQKTQPCLFQVDLCQDESAGIVVIPLSDHKHEFEITFKDYANTAKAVCLGVLMLLGFAK